MAGREPAERAYFYLGDLWGSLRTVLPHFAGVLLASLGYAAIFEQPDEIAEYAETALWGMATYSTGLTLTILLQRLAFAFWNPGKNAKGH